MAFQVNRAVFTDDEIDSSRTFLIGLRIINVQDFDNDGLSDYWEYENGSDPSTADYDCNGLLN